MKTTILNKKDLPSLYPTPKTYDELAAEQKRRAMSRRPRFMSAKVSLWTTLVVVICVSAYRSISYLMTYSMASSDNAILGVSASILIGLGALAMFIYLFIHIDRLVAKVLTARMALYVILIVICSITIFTLVTFAQSHDRNLLITTAVLLGHLVVTYSIVAAVVKRWRSDDY